jgi:hypothetical protein
VEHVLRVLPKPAPQPQFTARNAVCRLQAARGGIRPLHIRERRIRSGPSRGIGLNAAGCASALTHAQVERGHRDSDHESGSNDHPSPQAIAEWIP